MSDKQKDETRAAIVAHVMTAGHVPGVIDKSELCRAAYLVAGQMERSDGDEVPAKITPATASRLLDAVSGLAVHAGLTARGDAGEEVKNVVTPGSKQPSESKDDSKKKVDEDEDKEPTLGDVVKLLANVSDRLDSLGKRQDTLDAKHGAAGDDGQEDGKPEAMAADGAFAVACDDILTAADKEARHPTQIPDGWLTERVEQRGGHTYTKFYGRPKAWMGQFMPQGRVVKNVRQVAPDGRIEGTLYQKG